MPSEAFYKRSTCLWTILTLWRYESSNKCQFGRIIICLLISQVNEAFAAQFLAVEKELDLDRNKTNMNGGAIALGHPLAASGSRITAHLVHELRRKSLKYAVGSACIGGGQGIAVLLERV